MSLCWEVHDPARLGQLAVVEHEHLPEDDLLALAGLLIGLEVAREGILELQRDALAHDPDRVDGVHQHIHIGVEQIAACVDEPRHEKYQSLLTLTGVVTSTVVSAADA